MDLNGNIAVSDNAVVQNHVLDKAIEVTSIKLNTGADWAIGSMDDDFSQYEADSKVLALSFRHDTHDDSGVFNLTAGNWNIAAADVLKLNMAAKIPVQTMASDESEIANVEFVLNWAVDANAMTSDANTGARDQDDINAGVVIRPVGPSESYVDIHKMRTALKSLTGSITFVDAIYAGDGGIDISEAGDRSVLAVIDGQDAIVYGHNVCAPCHDDNVKHSGDEYYCCWMFLNFEACSIDLSGLDTSKMESMEGMFEDCHNLTRVNLSGLDTGNVMDMGGMFWNCYNLTSLDLSGFDTGNVRDMSGMFFNCYNLTSLDLSSFDTSNVGNIDSSDEIYLSYWSFDCMFYDCSAVVTATSDVRNDVMNYAYYHPNGAWLTARADNITWNIVG